MLLRSRFRDKFIWVRAQAVVVALLYVFLCTFGPLTHTHVGHDHAAAVGARAVTSGRAARQAVRAERNKRALSAIASCAFCDWQANSQGRAVTPLRLVAPTLIACVHVPCAATTAAVALTRASSRAPPATL